MSSNKNLKVYKMVFLTHLKKLTMSVKFACKMKATWKRSNQSAQTAWVPLDSGTATFDQTLRLKVNMYFDTVKSKFVEKKCMYSFIIGTEKGEKNAGNVTIDLAQFFNKRIYEMEQEFALEKCPVAGAKVDMKIYYEEDQTQQDGYDSMSCISATNPMDSSVASVDLSQILPATKSNLSSGSKRESSQIEKSEGSELSTSKTEKELAAKVEENFSKLDASDVVEYPHQGSASSGGRNIGENIKSINSLTNKINEFVTDKSKNIKYQIQGFKRKISSLEEQVQGEVIGRERMERELEEERRKNGDLQKQFSDFRLEVENQLEVERKKNSQIEGKLSSSQQLLSQMETQMNQSGESQSSYIEQLKINHQTTEKKLSSEIEELRESLLAEKRGRNDLASKITELQGTLKEVRQKYTMTLDKQTMMEDDMRRKEEEMEATRVHLERTFDNLVSSLGNLV